MEKDYGFQLYLADNDNKILSPLIEKLQNKYTQSLPFIPHISIHTAISTDLKKAVEALEVATLNTKPFTVYSDGCSFQNKWSKILYIKLKNDNILTAIHKKIGNKLTALDSRPFIPHISLMYKDELDNAVRQKIVSEIKIPQSFIVQGVEILHPGENNKDWRDYSKWKVVYRKEFS